MKDEQPVTLKLRDISMTILDADIPEPPPLRCNGRIEDIAAIWNDGKATWTRSSPLRIKGVSIPVIYWRELYQHRRTDQWSLLKRRWWDYKVRTYFRSYTAL